MRLPTVLFITSVVDKLLLVLCRGGFFTWLAMEMECVEEEFANSMGEGDKAHIYAEPHDIALPCTTI